MKIKAIIFDFDGVILESVDVKGRAFAHLFQHYPDKVGEIVALHASHGGMSRFEKFEMIYQDILCQPLSPERKEQLGREFSGYVYKKVLESPFVDGAKEFLEAYYNKVPLFIASGTPDAEIKSIVKDRGLEKYFKGIYGSPAKKKDIILKIIKDFSFSREELIFVGDSIDDEEGAKGAGIKFVWRTEENSPFKELEKSVET